MTEPDLLARCARRWAPHPLATLVRDDEMVVVEIPVLATTETTSETGVVERRRVRVLVDDDAAAGEATGDDSGPVVVAVCACDDEYELDLGALVAARRRGEPPLTATPRAPDPGQSGPRPRPHLS